MRDFWNNLYIVYEAVNFFLEEPFLPALLKRGKNEHWISACGNAANGWTKRGRVTAMVRRTGNTKRTFSFSSWKLA